MAEGEYPAGHGEEGDGGNGEGEVKDERVMGEGIDAGEEAAEEDEGGEDHEGQGQQTENDGGAVAAGGFAPESICAGGAGTLKGLVEAMHGGKSMTGREGGSAIISL